MLTLRAVPLRRLADPCYALFFPISNSVQNTQKTTFDGREYQGCQSCAILPNGQPVLAFYNANEDPQEALLSHGSQVWRESQNTTFDGTGSQMKSAVQCC